MTRSHGFQAWFYLKLIRLVRVYVYLQPLFNTIHNGSKPLRTKPVECRVKYVFDGVLLLQDDESKPEGDVGDGGAVCGSGQSPGAGLRLVPRLPHEVRLRNGQGNNTKKLLIRLNSSNVSRQKGQKSFLLVSIVTMTEIFTTKYTLFQYSKNLKNIETQQ